MYDDDVRIRPALPEEANVLTDIAWQSKSYWDYSQSLMNKFRSILNITQDFIETNPTYLLENEENEEIIGFYSLESKNSNLWLRYLCVIPSEIGNGLGSKMFCSACEMAEVMGAEFLYILSEENTEEFYTHMGAEKIGEKFLSDLPQIKHSVLRVEL